MASFEGPTFVSDVAQLSPTNATQGKFDLGLYGEIQMYVSDIAFTPTVKAVQARMGSRRSYARMEQSGGWAIDISSDLADFIAGQRSFFFATSNAEGQPYIQHRGGPRGFLHVLGARSLGFADVAGNRQYISIGNLEENAKVHLFLIDYANRQRIKI